MKKVKLKILKPFGKFKKGDIVKLEVTENGIVKDDFWARRLKDSVVDKCVELVKEKLSNKKSISNKGEK